MIFRECQWDVATQVYYLRGTDENGHLRMFGVPRETIEDVIGEVGSFASVGEAVATETPRLQVICSALAAKFPDDPFIMITGDLWPSAIQKSSSRT